MYDNESPYDRRWTMYCQAESLAQYRFSAAQEKWVSEKDAGRDPGPYPQFPTDEDIYQIAERMKKFVACKGDFL